MEDTKVAEQEKVQMPETGEEMFAEILRKEREAIQTARSASQQGALRRIRRIMTIMARLGVSGPDGVRVATDLVDREENYLRRDAVAMAANEVAMSPAPKKAQRENPLRERAEGMMRRANELLVLAARLDAVGLTPDELWTLERSLRGTSEVY